MKLRTSLKKLLATVGLAAIVVPASISVAGCDFRRFIEDGPGSIWDSKDSNALVVEAINNTNFTLAVYVGHAADDVKSTICVRFIGARLSGNIQKLYDSSLFIKHDILNANGGSLLDDDLQSPGIINAKIFYSYAEFKDQKTNLILKVISK